MRVTGKLCETGEVVTLRTEGRRIAGWEPGVREPDLGGPDIWLSPGFIDVQLNGYCGADFNIETWGHRDEAAADLSLVFELAARAGTPLLCPTFITNSHGAIVKGLTRLLRVLEQNRSLVDAVPGIHVEGPYISAEDGPRGAHPIEHVRLPDWEEFQRFQEAAQGKIKILTLAPELPGALPFIEKVADAGVVVAIGHSGAEPEVIRDAVRAGAQMSTHLGNGAHGTIRRHPNYIWEQLAHDDLYASIITDGHHLPASVCKSFARVKGPEKLVLVSDAVALGGLQPGVYAGGRYEVLPTGKVVTAGTPYLAGAGHLLDTCLANALRFTDLSLAQVIRCASTIPARILGLESRKGHLRVGYDADLTLFRVPDSGPLQIEATVRAGERVYDAPAR